MADNRTIEAQRYLEDYQALARQRDALLDARDDLRAAAARVNPDGEAPGEEAVQKALDHVGEAIAVRLVLLERMEDEQLKTVLILRYINGLDWEDVARGVGYCRSQTFHLHRDALKAFAIILRNTL